MLIVHGTKDTFVDVELSRRFAPLFGAGAELYEPDGAQHGFAVHDDPTYAHPQSQAWQREVVAKVADFLSLQPPPCMPMRFSSRSPCQDQILLGLRQEGRPHGPPKQSASSIAASAAAPAIDTAQAAKNAL
ncbi:hypothetical protein [Kitasatospora sp. NPDC098663]|uniref:hypothetical protein n=1 Tax=Kitasatospora sp. NPDC098663 TaxID=3364096 RepID=UPI00380120E5